MCPCLKVGASLCAALGPRPNIVMVLMLPGYCFANVRVVGVQAVMMHDFAVTEDYAILLDTPLCFRPQVLHTAAGEVLHGFTHARHVINSPCVEHLHGQQ